MPQLLSLKVKVLTVTSRRHIVTPTRQHASTPRPTRSARAHARVTTAVTVTVTVTSSHYRLARACAHTRRPPNPSVTRAVMRDDHA